MHGEIKWMEYLHLLKKMSLVSIKNIRKVYPIRNKLSDSCRKLIFRFSDQEDRTKKQTRSRLPPAKFIIPPPPSSTLSSHGDIVTGFIYVCWSEETFSSLSRSSNERKVEQREKNIFSARLFPLLFHQLDVDYSGATVGQKKTSCARGFSHG